MRFKIAGAVLCFASIAAFAEDKAVLNEEDQWKLYTTPTVTFMDVSGDTASIASLGIGTILNDHWYFGVRGNILMNSVSTDSDDIDATIGSWDMWDAGGEIGYIFAPAKLFHWDASLYFGGGQASVDNSEFGGNENAGYLALEPDVSLAVNMHETWELGVGVGYRFTDGFDVDGISDNDMSALTWRVFARATEF